MKGLTSESMTPQTTIIGLVGILLFASWGAFLFYIFDRISNGYSSLVPSTVLLESGLGFLVLGLGLWFIIHGKIEAKQSLS